VARIALAFLDAMRRRLFNISGSAVSAYGAGFF